jgi:hypothetical protein
MKTLNFYTLIISVFLFLSCEKKKDPDPVIPVLKGFSTEGTSPNRTVKSNYSLIYVNDKLSNLQRIDTIVEVGSPIRTLPALNNILTEEASGGYKLISDFAIGGTNGYTISKVENIAQKTANGYDIVTVYSSSLTIHSQIELNANNQMVKYATTKIVNTNTNGVKRETPQNGYYRYEYDSNGNVTKVFLKDIGSAPEVLSNEFTYDDKPNPYKDSNLKWIFRLSGLGGSGGIESKNNVLTSKNYQQGVLLTETTGVYTYDTQSGYPLTLSTSGKSFSPNTSVGTGKTVFKY